MSPRVGENFLEKLPEELIVHILGYFQSEKILPKDNQTHWETLQKIYHMRKYISIKTDIQSLSNLSMVSVYFNNLLTRENIGNLLWTVHHISNKIITRDRLNHIEYCRVLNCRNICHYGQLSRNYSP